MQNEPLNPSPLILHGHVFKSIHLDAAELDQETPGNGTLGTSRRFFNRSDDPKQWVVELTVRFGPENEETPTPYRGNCTVEGLFEVHSAYPGDPERLIRITATSMLYGSAREMIANLTARGPHGIVNIPSVSFFEEEPKKKQPPKKRAKKTQKGGPKQT